MPAELRTASTPGAVAHQILLVEDDPQAAAAVSELLTAHDYKVAIAKDGGQAQSNFVMKKPDLVIVDLILPGESGFEVCERFKRLDETTPVVVLSAIGLPEAKALADRVGADAYLVKPVEPERLIETIESTAQRLWEKFHLGGAKESKRIRFSCRCGKRFRVSPVHRGKTLTCPECGEPLVVPRHE